MIMKKPIILLLPVFIFLLIVSCGNEGRQSESDENEQKLEDTELLSLSEVEKKYYLEAGNEISAAVFGVLSSELMSAMQTEGVRGALSYCNIQAYPLTDSLSKKFNARVSRLAELYRNPDNKLVSDLDHKIFEDFKKMDADTLHSGEKVVSTNGGQVLFYKPILLQPQCMACHGPKSAIGEENLELIKSLYPEDLAINFNPGDLRGMWKIEMKLRTDL